MHRILVVDDHTRIRNAICSLLRNSDFEVCGEAVNGRDAIDKAKQLHPDLILLDLSMPIMNGLDAARELTRIMPDVPLLMVTNHAMALPESEARKVGIRLVLSKENSYQNLVRCTREILASNQLSQWTFRAS
jgi:DNA-binding NarL/FixJ family response regulator